MRPTGTTPKPTGMKPTDRRTEPTHTSRAELNHKVQKLSARVAELEGALSDMEGFAAQAAHELLTPLVMAETFAGMVGERLDRVQYADSRRDLESLARSAARTRRLVEALLHEARSAGRPPWRERVDLGALARDAVAMLAPEVERRAARVEIDELPAVSGEPELLGAVLVNLLVNALKYNPRQAGTIRVSAECDADWCTIHVDDEAPPVPEEDRERIFQPYHRGRNERRVRGAGLGLAICRRIVERHGGTIGVTRAPTGGNRFSFTVPPA
jgi:signal transduction histidine kinase